MTAVIVGLAVAAVTAAGTAVAMAIRVSGVKDDLGKAELLLVSERARAEENAAEVAELKQALAQAAALDRDRRAAIEKYRAATLRCVDPEELRRLFNELVSPPVES